MAITKKRLAELRKQHGHTRVGAYVALTGLLIESLAPQERQIWLIIREEEKADTGLLAERCHTNQRVINTTLQRLMSYGLVKREKVVTEAGRYYLYSLS